MDAKYLEEIKARCEKMDSQQGDALGAAKWEVEMHSTNDIPTLLAEVERLQKENQGWRANSMIQESVIQNGYDPADKDKIVKLILEKSAKDDKIATLKKALELAIEWVGRFDCPASADCKIENPVKNCDDCCGEPTSDCWYRYFIQQAQEEKK